MQRQFEAMQEELNRAKGVIEQQGVANHRLMSLFENQEREQRNREEGLQRAAEERVHRCRNDLQRAFETRMEAAEAE